MLLPSVCVPSSSPPRTLTLKGIEHLVMATF